MVVQGLLGRALELAQFARNLAAEAERDRRSRRQENDRYVTGGVNWNGYGLESLIKMVAERASPNQLDALAGEWRRHGSSVVQASTDLQRSLNRLMAFWNGASAGEAARTVTTNARWIGELGETAQQMADPIQDAGGALRSAQDTMPGKPSDHWYAGAGGGALAGFAIGGPIGAAFGAAIGGIASAFGFGSSKKKLKRKAVQTMQRFETAVLGIDGTTPQFGTPSDGVDPGIDPIRDPGPGVGTPEPGPVPPNDGRQPILTPLPPGTDISTVPSLADGDAASRWRGLTGGPNLVGPGGLGQGGQLGLGQGLGGFPGGMPPGVRGGGPVGRGPVGRGGTGRGPVPGALGAGPGGRGSTARTGGRGVGRGVPGPGAFGGGGRGGAGQDGEHKGRNARGAGARGGYGAGGLGAGARGGIDEDAERRGRGRFGRGGVLEPHAGGYGATGAGTRREEDEEHHRRFPVEEDPFSSSDLKAAPPVIGL